MATDTATELQPSPAPTFAVNKFMSLSGIGAEVIKNTVFTAYKSSVYKHVVPGAGVEPAPLESDKILSLACLPISPPGQ